jgi:hypothetical protein
VTVVGRMSHDNGNAEPNDFQIRWIKGGKSADDQCPAFVQEAVLI